MFSFFISFLMSQSLWAAPHPAASLLSDPTQGLFWRSRGYTLQTPDKNWSLSKKEEREVFVFKKPSMPALEISINEDKIKEAITLESYTRRWIKDYLHFGFQISSSKNFREEGQKGLLIDLWHGDTKKRIRQGVFLKGKKAVVITCTSEEKTFDTDVKACNDILKSFHWL